MTSSAEYAVANPAIGAAVAVAVVRGERDDVVLPEYSVPAAASPVTEIDIAGEDHFDLIDPASRSWASVGRAARGVCELTLSI